jgi:hypothetical protein
MVSMPSMSGGALRGMPSHGACDLGVWRPLRHPPGTGARRASFWPPERDQHAADQVVRSCANRGQNDLPPEVLFRARDGPGHHALATFDALRTLRADVIVSRMQPEDPHRDIPKKLISQIPLSRQGAIPSHPGLELAHQPTRHPDGACRLISGLGLAQGPASWGNALHPDGNLRAPGMQLGVGDTGIEPVTSSV